METINISNPGELPANGDTVTYIYPNGARETKTYYDPPPPSSTPTFYAHVDISDGDGEAIPGIANDGIDSCTVSADIRYGEDVGSGLVAAMPNANYRITLRDASGAEYDVIKVPFVGGQALISYTTTLRPATIHIDTSDLSIPGVDCKIEVVGDNLLKIFRDFTGA